MAESTSDLRASSSSRQAVRIDSDRPLAEQCNTVAAGFIKAESFESQTPETSWARLQTGIRKCLRSTSFSALLGCVIVIDICLCCYEIDNHAMGLKAPSWLPAMRNVILVVYVLELLLVVSTRGVRALKNPWVATDAVIVAGGLFDLLAGALRLDDGGVLLLVRFLRVFRILRLVRVFGKLKFLSELQKLVRMATSCLKTLFWSFVFTFMVTTFWAMAAVELLRPYLLEVAQAGGMDGGCGPQCMSSLDTVMHANLLLFKTVVAGDAWGQIAVPIILQHPWTALIFLGSHMTIIFGALNLVVAVVVDEFAESRAKDYELMAEELENSHGKDTAYLTAIFADIDADDSGEVELEELLEGARKVPEFRDRLRVLDIDESDLKQLFNMLDNDGSGTISSSEFINALSRWMHDSKTAARFTKYNLMKNLEETEDMRFAIMTKLDRLEQRFQDRMDATMQDLVAKLATTDANFSRSDSCVSEQVIPLVPPGEFSTCRASDQPAEEVVQRCLQRALQQIKKEMLLNHAPATEDVLREAEEAVRALTMAVGTELNGSSGAWNCKAAAWQRSPTAAAAAAATELKGSSGAGQRSSTAATELNGSSGAVQKTGKVVSSEIAEEPGGSGQVQATYSTRKEIGNRIDSQHPEMQNHCIEANEEVCMESISRANSFCV